MLALNSYKVTPICPDQYNIPRGLFIWVVLESENQSAQHRRECPSIS